MRTGIALGVAGGAIIGVVVALIFFGFFQPTESSFERWQMGPIEILDCAVVDSTEAAVTVLATNETTDPASYSTLIYYFEGPARNETENGQIELRFDVLPGESVERSVRFDIRNYSGEGGCTIADYNKL